MKKLLSLLSLLFLLSLPVMAHAYLLAAMLGSGGTVSAPSAPTGVSASPGNTQNTITWTNGTGATSHNLLWGTSAGSEPNTITGITTPYTHTGLTNGTTYYYKVQSANSAGTATSSEVSATPTAGFNYNLNTTTFPTADLSYLVLGTATYGNASDGIVATTGGVTITTISNTDKAVVMFKNPIDLTASHTYRLRVKVTSGVAWVGLFHFGATPALSAGTYSNLGPSSPLLVDTYNNATATTFATHTSSDTVDQAQGSHTPAFNVEYDYKAVVDANNITFSVTRVSDSVVMASYAYPKSSLYSYPAGTIYFAAGKHDPYGTTASSVITQAQMF